MNYRIDSGFGNTLSSVERRLKQLAEEQAKLEPEAAKLREGDSDKAHELKAEIERFETLIKVTEKRAAEGRLKVEDTTRELIKVRAHLANAEEAVELGIPEAWRIRDNYRQKVRDLEFLLSVHKGEASSNGGNGRHRQMIANLQTEYYRLKNERDKEIKGRQWSKLEHLKLGYTEDQMEFEIVREFEGGQRINAFKGLKPGATVRAADSNGNGDETTIDSSNEPL